MTIHGRSLIIPVLLSSLLCACGGGGSDSGTPTVTPSVCSTCTAGHLSGTAATGSAASSAEVLIIDAQGKSVKATTDANGAYTADVSGLTAPFMIQVVSNVGGEAVVLHSLATSDDVGKNAVNVTPLTELLTATVLGSIPEANLNGAQVDLGKVTSTSLATAEQTVKALVQPVLDAAGVGSADIRTTEFKADRSGLDKALDALKVSASGNTYAISLVDGSSRTTLDPAQPSAGKALGAPGAQTLESVGSTLSGIQSQLDALAKLYATEVPTADALTPFLAGGFHHDGQDAAGFIGGVLRQVDADSEGGFSYQGVSFDNLRIENVIDANTVEASWRVVFRSGFRASDERMKLKLVGGKWLFAGNGLDARVRVSMLARLKEKPLSYDQVLALPGIKTYLLTQNGVSTLNYQQTISTGNGGTYDLWLGHPGQDYFGVNGWAGDNYGAENRLLRYKYNAYYATPDARVTNYIAFTVPTARVSSKVAAITVTGPGLPSGGLALEPPVRRIRPYWVFKGDSFDWNTFNNDRCTQIDNPSNPVPDCAMDWSKVRRGSEYTFTLKDANGAVVSTLSDKLRFNPVDEAQALAQKDKLFPQFVMNGETPEFTYHNFMNDVDGPFLPGKSIKLNWKLPDQLGFRLTWVRLSIQMPKLNSSGVYVGDISESNTVVPYCISDPKQTIPTSRVFKLTHSALPQSGYANINGIDAFGNVWDHELNMSNPR